MLILNLLCIGGPPPPPTPPPPPPSAPAEIAKAPVVAESKASEKRGRRAGKSQFKLSRTGLNV
jgi:hypothetical protein